MKRTIAAVGAAALTASLATTVVGTTSGTAGAAVDEPVFTLSTPDRVVAWKSPGRDRVGVDMALRIVGGSEDFEIRSSRPSWDEEIVTTWSAGSAGGTFPTGIQKDFGSLRRFLVVDYRTLDGELVDRRRGSICLNGWSERVRPDAEPRAKYPWGCPGNPYTVGSVQGVQAGWATPLTGRFQSAALDRGRYDVTVRVADRWADSFGLSAAERSRTFRLRVRSSRGHQHHDHAHRVTHRPAADRVARPAAREPAEAAAGAVGGPRPDLRSLPAFDISLNERGTRLRFSATVWNAGDSPLVVDGFRRGDEPVMDAYQYFFDAEGDQVGYERVGELKYHEANHQHWHFQDFARYRLLDMDGDPVRTSGKVSFCLANTDAVDYTVPGADWHPENTDLSTACGEPGSLSIREVLASGSGDTYAQFRAGQAIRVAGLPNGWYQLAVEANPDGNLVEHDTTNNVSLRPVRLVGTPERRRLRVPQVGIIDESVRGGGWWW